MATCALITAGVLSLYSYIAPLITDRAGLATGVIPFALMAFGAGALVGNIVGGRLGDAHPYATPFVTAGVSFLAWAGICAFSALPVALLALFTLLGLVGLSANPIMISLALRFGGEAATLAAAMPTSIFNLGTAIGTGITSDLLGTSLGVLAPAMVAVVFSAPIFLPLTALVLIERRSTSDGRATVTS